MLTKENHKVILDVSQDISQDVSQDVSEDVLPDVSEYVSQDVFKDVSQDVSQDISLEKIEIKLEPEIKQKKIQKFTYSPKQQDGLFWCIYIIIKGYNDYISIDRNYGIVKLEIKQKIGEFIKENSNKMKNTNYKITKINIQEIMSELITVQKDTSILCLLTICIYYKINIILIHPNKKLMLEFISNQGIEQPYYVIYKENYGKYTVDPDQKTIDDINKMKETIVCLDNYFKPIKGLSQYKVEELEKLASKLGLLDTSKKYKKSELYNIVGNAVIWEK